MPVCNEEVADIFERYGDLLEISGANPFRVRAYRNAARMLRNMQQEAAEAVKAGEDLSALPTIGKDLADKIEEIVRTGRFREFDAMKHTMPAELAEMNRIAGLGPKRIKALHKDLGVKSMSGLRAAARSGKVRGLPGFGEKTELAILEYFESDRSDDKRMRLFDAQKVAERITAHMATVADPKFITVAGSYRRRKETVGDLDVLVAAADPNPATDHFLEFDEIARVTASGRTKSTVILRGGLQVDLRVVRPDSYGAALVYFTGSKAHNIAIRKRAANKKLKINEYGVFKGKESVAGRTEKQVYESVDLPLIPPELREMNGEIEAAAAGKLPKLVEADDIRGDLHTHTKATDGANSIREMALAARKRGYDYIAITDHTKHMTIARGLDARRLSRQIAEIDKLNDALSGIRILKSAEVDILADGSLDLPDNILSKLDLTVCAIHYDFKQSAEKQTDRIIRAMEHPSFSILAHPTCRLIGERDPMRINMERLMDAAIERGCYFEVNGQPERLDLNDFHCRMAKERGLKLSLATDAHSAGQLDLMDLCVGQARRGWIEKSDVINARPWRELKRLLRR